jgi:FtsH-binding integral membrane protein
MDSWSSAAPVSRTRTAEFMASVYRWMAFGLGLTGIVAWAVTSSPSLLRVFYQVDEAGNRHSAPAMWIALIAWFLLGVAFNPIAQRAAIGAAVAMFLTFCALSGVVFSSIVFQYTQASIFSTLFVTGGAFFALSVYGTVTKRNLDAWRSFLFMGLIGIVLAGIVNIFVRSNGLEFILSCAGVLVFAGLTAYDTQKLRQLGETGEQRHALIGALMLYLDFVNLFLFLLRFMGRRRD